MKKKTTLKILQSVMWFGVFAIITMAILRAAYPPGNPDLTTLGFILSSTGVFLLWRESGKLQRKIKFGHLFREDATEVKES